MDSNNSDANTDTSVDNSQKDKNSSSASEHCVPKSEPSASSTTLSTSPASPTITPLVTSPQNDPLISAPVLTSSPPSTLQSTPSSNSTTNNLTTTTVATHKTQAAFVNKLYTMVEDQSIQQLISWAPSGDVFSVSNPTEFSKMVLPQYFKHNNWQSFVRQLNMYGFHKVNDMFHANPTSESQAWEFKHPEFRRGQLAALQNIKRKSSKHHSIPINPGKGGLPGADPGLPLDITADAMRDERIECLTSQMSDITERMRQMNENFSLLYAETVSCRMQQSKHEKVITDIANFLSSTFREENSNDPRSLKRKFDLDCIQAEIAKFGQNDVPPSSYPSMMPYHPPNYPREGMHQSRSMSTPQPMVGVESSSPYHPSQVSDVDYRSSSFSDSHRPPKIPSHSPLSMLPEIPFSHFRSGPSYRHRSIEPANLSRTLSPDTSYRPSKPPTNSHNPQSSSQYVHHTPHRSSTLPTLTQSVNSSNRRASHPNTSLSFGSDSNLLNPPENNRYEKDDDTAKSQRIPLSSSPPSTSYTNSENPVVANSTTRQRSPPLPDPPDNDVEYNNKRCKRN